MIGHTNSYFNSLTIISIKVNPITFPIKSRQWFPHLQWKELCGEAYMQRRVSQVFSYQLLVGKTWGRKLWLLKSCLFPLKKRKLKNQKASGTDMKQQYLALRFLFSFSFLGWEPIGCIHLTQLIKTTQGPNSAVGTGCRQLARLQERAHHYLFSPEKSRGQHHIHMCRRHLREHKLLNGMRKPTKPKNLPCWV